ncbi:nitroreductase/quinone reductase family protein [Nocardia sp. NPDC051030]|uniref:nitroreductase/quinone reductase family protein n=1 Tax=Nocardia sp. NPDC051030 TaxID=3155162 RepID=UPI003416F517
MSSPAKPATTPQSGRTQRSFNAIMRALLRSPLHGLASTKLLIITVTGRKTGHRYENPVGYVEHEGHILIGTAARWPRNLRPGEPAHLELRRRTLTADWEIITDEDRMADLYRIILTHNPTHGRFAGISLEPDGTVNRDELRAAREKGTAVVRLRVHPAP